MILKSKYRWIMLVSLLAGSGVISSTGRAAQDAVTNAASPSREDFPEAFKLPVQTIGPIGANSGDSVSSPVHLRGTVVGERMTAIGVMAIIIAMSTLWVLMLRRKVYEQTASLKESETKFRSLVEKSLVGVYIIQDGRYAYVNPRMAEIFGYTLEEMTSMEVSATVYPEDEPIVKEQIRRRIEGEAASAQYRYRKQRKDGSVIHVEVIGSRTEYRGRPALVGTLMDITERKQAEEEVFNSRQMLRTVLDTIPQQVFWKNRDSVITGCNKAFAEACGCFNSSDMVGKTGSELSLADISDGDQAQERQIMDSGDARLNYEELHHRPDGSECWLKINKVPLFDKLGNVSGVLGTYEDITEHRRSEAALAEASSLLETLLDNSPDCIYFKDAQSRFVRASKSIAELFHVPNASNLIGKTDFDFFLPDHAQPAFDDEQEIMRTGQPLVGKPERESYGDGRVTWALTTKLPWRDKDGKIIGTFGISKNMTASKIVEEQLARERNLFRALVENLPDAIYFKDRESRFVRLSKSKAEEARQALIARHQAENAAGELPPHLADPDKCAEFLIGKTDFDICSQDRAQPAYEQEQEILRTGQPLIGHIERFTKPEDGKASWYHTTKMPWLDEDGNVVGTFGVTRDVTALKEAEAVLDYERELFRTLLEHLPDYIYFKDLQSRFLRISRSKAASAQEAVQEQHPGEPVPDHLANLDTFSQYLIGKTDFDTFPEERARDAYDDEQNIIRTGIPLIGKVERTQFHSGKIAWCISTKMPWRNKEGQIIGTFGVSKDITALKEAEGKLESVHQRLVETSRLAGMAEVATDVLHNVGNVLNSVNISCSLTMDRIKSLKISGLAKMSGLFQEHREHLPQFFSTDPRGQQIPTYLAALSEHLSEDQASLLKELEQLLKHIDHIKQIVAMQQSYAKVAGVKENISVNQLVEDALHMNAAALIRHDVHVKREFEETPCINTEKHKVLQILVNLIRNAKYAMDDAKRPDKLLRIKIGTHGNSCVRIQIIDNGVGIPPENLTRIFAHGFTTRRNGHGFGLHSGALAVRELGGSLEVHSDGTGKGAVFTLSLPLKETPLKKPEPQKYEPVAI